MVDLVEVGVERRSGRRETPFVKPFKLVGSAAKDGVVQADHLVGALNGLGDQLEVGGVGVGRGLLGFVEGIVEIEGVVLFGHTTLTFHLASASVNAFLYRTVF